VQQNTNQPSHELKHKTPKHNASNKSRKPLAVVTIMLAVALALIVGGYFGYKYYKNRQDSAITTDSREVIFKKDMLNPNSSDETRASAVASYSEDYGKSLEATSNTNPAKWDKAKVDDAYVTLLYVNKMGSFSQTLQYIALLEIAKAGGVDIDNNSYGIDQRTRDEIYKTAKQESDKALGQKGTGN
jgi:predicted negative regulator of RcsB-dependent stress response